jgi:uroporphyrinogen-III synthase
MADYTLVIRPQPDADRDVAWLRRYRVPALASPVMQGTHLKTEMPNPDGFGGVVFTSRHAVDAMDLSAGYKGWCDKPAFVVGNATADAARRAGFDWIIMGSGGGRGLVPAIKQDYASRAMPLFWPSAEDIGFDIAASMAAIDLAVVRWPVYRMDPVEALCKPVCSALAARSIGAVIGMSARSVRLFRDNLYRESAALDLQRISLIAGSNVIAEAAGAGWREILVARQPRRSRLLAIAVLRYQRDNGQ